MTKLIAIIPAADYLYMCRFTSNEETRYYLCGVFVDVVNRRMVATDGHRLGMLNMGDGLAKGDDVASFILSNNKDLQRACKASRYETVWLRCYDDRLEIIKHPNGANAADYVAYDGAVDMTYPASKVYVDGTFPDYVKILPKELSGLITDTKPGIDGAPGEIVAHGVNADLLASMKGPDTKQSAIKLIPNGGSPWLAFNTDERFMGVLMPMRYGVTPSDAMARLEAFKAGK